MLFGPSGISNGSALHSLTMPLSFFNKNLIMSGVPKICLVDFLVEFNKTYKNHEIFGECVGVPGNYSIFELKLCRYLTSAQRKNESFSSLDSCLESKKKNTLKIILHRLH